MDDEKGPMPVALYRPKASRKRKYFKSRRSGEYAKYKRRNIRSAGLYQTVAPRSISRRLRYTERFTLNPGPAGAGATVVYRANDIFDPTDAVGGHQPPGFDEYMTFYDHFTVVGSKCRAILFNASEVAGDRYYVTLDLRDRNTPQVDVTVSISNQKGLAVRSLGGAQGGSDVVEVDKGFSAKKFFRISSFIGKDQYRGSIGAAPTELAYYHINAYPGSTGSDPAAVNGLVVIDYIVFFSEPKQLENS